MFITALVTTVKNGKLPKCPLAAEDANKWWHFNIKKCHRAEKMTTAVSMNTNLKNIKDVGLRNELTQDHVWEFI